MRTGAISAVSAVLLLAAGCGGREDAATPRPMAYPRMEVPPAEYTEAPTPLHFLVNSHATVTKEENGDDASQWYTIAYPDYFPGMKIYCTFTSVSPETAAGVMANRTERMALNTGGAESELTTLRSTGGMGCTLMLTRTPVATPLQFMAADSAMVVSGAMYVDLPAGYRPDSIAPMVETVERDLLETLKSIGNGR